jgi:hypothetical protein
MNESFREMNGRICPLYAILIALPGWRDPTRSWFDRLTTNGPFSIRSS